MRVSRAPSLSTCLAARSRSAASGGPPLPLPLWDVVLGFLGRPRKPLWSGVWTVSMECRRAGAAPRACANPSIAAAALENFAASSLRNDSRCWIPFLSSDKRSRSVGGAGIGGFDLLSSAFSTYSCECKAKERHSNQSNAIMEALRYMWTGHPKYIHSLHVPTMEGDVLHIPANVRQCSANCQCSYGELR